MSLTPRLDKIDKNYLINSAKDLAQRSTSAENLSASYQFLTLDRHVHKTAGSFNGTPTVQRVQDSPDGKTKYCSEFSSDFASATAELYEAQPIESVNARDLAGENVSFSVWVKSDSCTTLKLQLSTADTEDDFSAVTQFHSSSKTITADGQWQEVKFEDIAVATGAERGVMVEVVLTDSDSTGATESHRLTRGKLNIGSEAQEWSLAGRDYADELSIAQRYYEKSYNLDTDPGTLAADPNAITWSCPDPGNSALNTWSFMTTKRAFASFTVFSPVTGASGNIRNDSGSTDVVVGVPTNNDKFFKITSSPSIAGGSQLRCHYTADAEVTI